MTVHAPQDEVLTPTCFGDVHDCSEPEFVIGGKEYWSMGSLADNPLFQKTCDDEAEPDLPLA